MADSLRHENFYRVGTYSDHSLGVYVGWAALEGSFSDGMPLENERGDLSLIFSGEDFRAARTVDSPQGSNVGARVARGRYLVRLCEDRASFPSVLNGRFHGLLVDRRQGTATLFNDRWGMHRLYFHQSREGFYFAAEAKAILAVLPETRRGDLQGIGEFIACGCTLENRSLFSSISVLPPASAWAFRNGEPLARDAYFRPSEWEDQEPLESEPFYHQLRDVFSRTVPLYFGADERVGMSLTGGLDTRMIMAWQKSPPGSMPCYSFGGAVRDCEDVILARKVAQACGQPHQVIQIGDEFLSRFPHYAERSVYLTDGCAGAAHAPDLFANERARDIAPVRMTGNYGGEVLRGVRAFKPVDPLPGLYDREMMRHVRQAHETYAELVRCHPVSFAAFRQAPWHHYGLLALEQTQLSLRSPFLDNDLVRTVFRAPIAGSPDTATSLRLVADGNPALVRIRTDRGLAGNGSILGTAVLRRILDLTAKAEYAYGDGMPQWLARIDHLVAAARLEQLFLGRHKFAHFRIWYRNVLGEYVREMLLDTRALSRPYLNAGTVWDVVDGHLKGTRNYTSTIHQLLSLEIFHRMFIDGN